MSMWKGLILVAGLVASTSAVAAPGRLSDTQFLQLSRCRALVASVELGGGDPKPIDAVLKTESRGREPYIADKAQSLQDEAAGAARHASGERRAKLVAERDGVCQSLMGPQTAIAAGAPANRAVN